MLRYSELRKNLNFDAPSAESEGLAFLTHYLQNSKNGVSQFFKPSAEAYYKSLIASASEVNDDGVQGLLPLNWDVPFPPPEHPAFTFIDLFAGIGGFRIAMQNNGGKCVFSSEYNPHAQKSYELNFGEVPFGDITKFDLEKIPPHDVLCAGFPCQPFSISGKMKGFEDTRGTLIYYVFKLLELRQPKVVILENVKHLVYHDKKRTLATITRHLQS